MKTIIMDENGEVLITYTKDYGGPTAAAFCVSYDKMNEPPLEIQSIGGRIHLDLTNIENIKF